MKKIDLNGKWHMTGNGFDCEGTIPGSVYSFLLDNNLMEDPYYRDNELTALALMDHPYTFNRNFDFKGDGNQVLLHCDGLDTLCALSINGKEIGYTKNMHRRYEFDITEILKDGENEISLRFDPAPPYLIEQREKWDQKVGGCGDALKGYPYLRKAHYMFGWDWGARIPDAGIWRDIYLLVKDSARITDHRIIQRHEGGKVYITPMVETDAPCDIKVTLTAPDGSTTIIPANQESEIQNPQLWWPNGMGEQPLYNVCAEINGDKSEKRIGLRTMKLIREYDEWGQGFCHEVNGVRFFAMGADYIPEDNILSRVTPERSRKLLMEAKNCNFNAIRIWGGGYYPNDFFFDICDELGLVLFVDMMVACCFLPDTDEIREEFKLECYDNLRRIRHHACIAVISGNNEVEQFGGKKDEYLKTNYLYMFEKMLPEAVKELCPELSYIPSSPTSCGHFIEPTNEDYGDSHYWKVWHGNKPYAEYRKHYFRYLSEFGFQSFPNEKTVNSFTLPEDRNIFSRIMERHQRNGTANGKILSYLADTFLYPADFSTLLYASQLLQATAIKYGVEHLRRNRGRCMGTLYWQFNDNWPVASWASIDYYGRYKALQYAAKRFYQPIMISCEEIGETSNRKSINAQADYYPLETSATLSVNNDTMEEISGKVTWKLCDSKSNILKSGSEEVTVPALSVFTLEKVDFDQTDCLENHLFYTFEMDGKIISYGSVLFTAPKHYNFKNPHLTATIDGDTITIKSDAYAMWVEIDSPDCDFILEDNYFDMEAGTRTIKVLEGKAENLQIRSVFDIQ